jgi:hypothetical protein
MFNRSDLSLAGAIDIYGMGHITDMTDDPATGTLWVVGFTMLEIPEYLDSNAEPFYAPYIAGIPYGSSEAVEAVGLYDPVLSPDNDLALPLSILWTGAVEDNPNFISRSNTGLPPIVRGPGFLNPNPLQEFYKDLLYQ